MTRSVLMVSEKFPPFNVSASARPFYFAKYLPEFGYRPLVVASTVLGSDERDDALLAELPPEVRVVRTPRLLSPVVRGLRGLRRRGSNDAAPRDAAPKGGGPSSVWSRGVRDLGWLTHWELDWSALATVGGYLAAQRAEPDIVWGTGPHFRNYVVAYRLAEWLDKPLVIDLRDPWTYGSLWNPRTPEIAAAERRWAARVLQRAAKIVFTSPLTSAEMQRRFPEVPRERFEVLTNGFDDAPVAPLRDVAADRCLFRYVGMLNERRHPDPLIQGFARAAEDPEFGARAVLEFIGSASGHEVKRALAPQCDVRFRGHVSRAESVRHMFGSDVNVLLQTISEGQDVISGKAFDYLHAKKPILAVVDEAGGDAWLVRETGAGHIASYRDVDAIARALGALFRAYREGGGKLPDVDVRRFTRRGIAERLARLLDDVVTMGGRRSSSGAAASGSPPTRSAGRVGR